jgi:flagellar biosynthesis protein FlhG
MRMTATSTLATIPNLVAIASGKGGVGKTWAAITLAQALSYLGQRVLLVDGDLGLANVDVQLGLSPQADLADAIAGRRAFADCTTAASGGAGTRGGFDVLAGRSGSAVLANLNPEEWARLLRGVSAMSAFYDTAIADLGAGVDGTVMNLALSAGRILIVLTDEPTSMTDAYAVVKRLSQSGRGSNIDILINMAQDHAEGRRTAATLIRAAQGFLNLELPVAGVVRKDPKVRDAIRRQTTLLSRHPQSPAAADITALAEDLVRDQDRAPRPAPRKLSAGLR